MSKRRAPTPNWDIAATFRFNSRANPGLLLVEAKAHKGELSDGSKSDPSESDGSRDNHQQIGEAIEKASRGLSVAVSGFDLSRDHHYQVSNRFAWAWKIATSGVPVVLVYLGFLNAREMANEGRSILADRYDWEEAVKEHCSGTVPDAAWDRKLEFNDAWVYPTILTDQINLPSES